MDIERITKIRELYPEYNEWTDADIQTALDEKPLVGFRLENPGYVGQSNSEVAFDIWRNNYSPETSDFPKPMGIISDKLKLTEPEFIEMLSVADRSGFTPTHDTDDIKREQGEVPDYNLPVARVNTAGRGFGLGTIENIASHGAAAVDKAMGAVGIGDPRRGERSYAETQRMYADILRDNIANYQADRPGEALATEVAGGITGAIVNPVKNIPGMNLVNTGTRTGRGGQILKAAGTGGAAGGYYGFMTSDGTPTERLEDAVSLAIPSALFGAGAQSVMTIGRSAPTRRLARTIHNSVVRPTANSLQAAAKAAYQNVHRLGGHIPGKAYKSIVSTFKNSDSLRLSGIKWADIFEVSTNYPALKRGLNLLEGQGRRRGRGRAGTSLEQFDETRRQLWRDWAKTSDKTEANLILDLIKGIDGELDNIQIQGQPSRQAAFEVARDAHRRHSNFEILDTMFEEAMRAAGSTGTGGNMQNVYKQTVNRILKNDRLSRFFKAEELDAMKDFVEYTFTERVSQALGKMSPSSGGLMGMLHFLGGGGSLVTGSYGQYAGLIAAMEASKRTGQSITRQRADDLMDFVGSGQMPTHTSGRMPGVVAPPVMETKVVQPAEERDEAINRGLLRRRSR